MATRRTFRCPACGTLQETTSSLLEFSLPSCPVDGQTMQSFFGDRRVEECLVNYGYRESRYATEESANIAKYQFTNL